MTRTQCTENKKYIHLKKIKNIKYAQLISFVVIYKDLSRFYCHLFVNILNYLSDIFPSVTRRR